MSHKHHIIPKYAGGTDEPSNLIDLSIEDHAEAHRKLYEEYGQWQDYVAWQGLAGLITKEELVRMIQKESAKNRLLTHGNPFTGIRTKTNFALDSEHQKKASELANSESAIKKKKKSFEEIGHQQKESNSQFGTVWCVVENADDLSDRKKYNKEQIPKGWITTTEWTDRRKDKNNNAYGRHWYNDGKKNYYLRPDDSKIEELNLQKRRLM